MKEFSTGETSLNEDQPGEIIASSKSSMNASGCEFVSTRVPLPAHTPVCTIVPLDEPLEAVPLDEPLAVPPEELLDEGFPDELPLEVLPPASEPAGDEPEEQAAFSQKPATSNEMKPAFCVILEFNCRIVFLLPVCAGHP